MASLLDFNPVKIIDLNAKLDKLLSSISKEGMSENEIINKQSEIRVFLSNLELPEDTLQLTNLDILLKHARDEGLKNKDALKYQSFNTLFTNYFKNIASSSKIYINNTLSNIDLVRAGLVDKNSGQKSIFPNFQQTISSNDWSEYNSNRDVNNSFGLNLQIDLSIAYKFPPTNGGVPAFAFTADYKQFDTSNNDFISSMSNYKNVNYTNWYNSGRFFDVNHSKRLLQLNDISYPPNITLEGLDEIQNTRLETYSKLVILKAFVSSNPERLQSLIFETDFFKNIKIAQDFQSNTLFQDMVSWQNIDLGCQSMPSVNTWNDILMASKDGKDALTRSLSTNFITRLNLLSKPDVNDDELKLKHLHFNKQIWDKQPDQNDKIEDSFGSIHKVTDWKSSNTISVLPRALYNQAVLTTFAPNPTNGRENLPDVYKFIGNDGKLLESIYTQIQSYSVPFTNNVSDIFVNKKPDTTKANVDTAGVSLGVKNIINYQTDKKEGCATEVYKLYDHAFIQAVTDRLKIKDTPITWANLTGTNSFQPTMGLTDQEKANQFALLQVLHAVCLEVLADIKNDGLNDLVKYDNIISISSLIYGWDNAPGCSTNDDTTTLFNKLGFGCLRGGISNTTQNLNYGKGLDNWNGMVIIPNSVRHIIDKVNTWLDTKAAPAPAPTNDNYKDVLEPILQALLGDIYANPTKLFAELVEVASNDAPAGVQYAGFTDGQAQLQAFLSNPGNANKITSFTEQVSVLPTKEERNWYLLINRIQNKMKNSFNINIENLPKIDILKNQMDAKYYDTVQNKDFINLLMLCGMMVMNLNDILTSGNSNAKYRAAAGFLVGNNIASVSHIITLGRSLNQPAGNPIRCPPMGNKHLNWAFTKSTTAESDIKLPAKEEMEKVFSAIYPQSMEMKVDDSFKKYLYNVVEYLKDNRALLHAQLDDTINALSFINPEIGQIHSSLELIGRNNELFNGNNLNTNLYPALSSFLVYNNRFEDNNGLGQTGLENNMKVLSVIFAACSLASTYSGYFRMTTELLIKTVEGDIKKAESNRNEGEKNFKIKILMKLKNKLNQIKNLKQTFGELYDHSNASHRKNSIARIFGWVLPDSFQKEDLTITSADLDNKDINEIKKQFENYVRFADLMAHYCEYDAGSALPLRVIKDAANQNKLVYSKSNNFKMLLSQLENFQLREKTDLDAIVGKIFSFSRPTTDFNTNANIQLYKDNENVRRMVQTTYFGFSGEVDNGKYDLTKNILALGGVNCERQNTLLLLKGYTEFLKDFMVNKKELMEDKINQMKEKDRQLLETEKEALARKADQLASFIINTLNDKSGKLGPVSEIPLRDVSIETYDWILKHTDEFKNIERYSKILKQNEEDISKLSKLLSNSSQKGLSMRAIYRIQGRLGSLETEKDNASNAIRSNLNSLIFLLGSSNKNLSLRRNDIKDQKIKLSQLFRSLYEITTRQIEKYIEKTFYKPHETEYWESYERQFSKATNLQSNIYFKEQTIGNEKTYKFITNEEWISLKNDSKTEAEARNYRLFNVSNVLYIPVRVEDKKSGLYAIHYVNIFDVGKNDSWSFWEGNECPVEIGNEKETFKINQKSLLNDKKKELNPAYLGELCTGANRFIMKYKDSLNKLMGANQVEYKEQRNNIILSLIRWSSQLSNDFSSLDEEIHTFTEEGITISTFYKPIIFSPQIVNPTIDTVNTVFTVDVNDLVVLEKNRLKSDKDRKDVSIMKGDGGVVNVKTWRELLNEIMNKEINSKQTGFPKCKDTKSPSFKNLNDAPIFFKNDELNRFTVEFKSNSQMLLNYLNVLTTCDGNTEIIYVDKEKFDNFMGIEKRYGRISGLVRNTGKTIKQKAGAGQIQRGIQRLSGYLKTKWDGIDINISNNTRNIFKNIFKYTYLVLSYPIHPRTYWRRDADVCRKIETINHMIRGDTKYKDAIKKEFKNSYEGMSSVSRFMEDENRVEEFHFKLPVGSPKYINRGGLYSIIYSSIDTD